MRKRKQRMILAVLAVIVTILALIAIVKGVERLTARKPDTTEGLAWIKAQESADIQEIEHEIKRIEDQERADAQKAAEDQANRKPKEIFSNSVIMGDSIAEGFLEFDVLNPSSVIAEIGVELDELDESIETVTGLNPQAVFLAYGMNDMIATNGDTKLFKKQYKGVINKMQEKLPNTRFFINSIFPMEEIAYEKKPIAREYETYNEVLRELCDELQITYIDNSELPVSDYHEVDGIHFTAGFYPIWSARMAEVAAL